MNSAKIQGKICAATLVALALIGLSSCQGLIGNGSNPNGSLQNSVNHIVVMAQENRSFDSYFGQLPAYWAANGYPSQQFDGLSTNASNPAYNGTTIPGSAMVNAYHLTTECFENLGPSWDESHQDWNLQNPTSSTALNNGFVYNAAQFSIDSGGSERGLLRHDRLARNGILRLDRFAVLLFHGFEFCHIGPLVLSGPRPHAAQPFVFVCRHVAWLRLRGGV
jgi:hypothetical protein